jgi:hypothetical protein
MRFALLLTGDRATAEDVVQDAFLGLYRARLPHRQHPPGRPAKVGSIVLIRRELHGPASWRLADRDKGEVGQAKNTVVAT